MNLKCQTSAIKDLEIQAKADRHSVMIEGPTGSGKSYLAKYYAKMLGVSDFVSVKSTVDDIRKSIDSCYSIESKVVVCIENLDSGVLAASYTLLKFLEEPRDNVYIVITCCNMYDVPDTIISRSSVVQLASPTRDDLKQFSSSYPEMKRRMVESRPAIWNSVKNFVDVDYAMNLSSTYCDHLENLINVVKSKRPVSDSVWTICHYPDNSEVPVKFAIQCIISNTKDSVVKKHAIKCIEALNNSRVAQHAIVSKFMMECKYGD